ncbi:disulfide bond formation protein DsbB, partial [Salmonella enterica subsp. enterica serovar Infantis]
LGIFASFLVVAIAVVIAQAFKPKIRDLFGR